MMRGISLLILIGVLANAEAAPVLRPHTTLETGQVRVGDLWDDVGERATDLVGPAPAPGTQIVIGSEQLAHIARLHGLDWRPATPADRTTLERPGRQISREEIIDALRPALTRSNDNPDDVDVELSAFVMPTIPTGVLPALSLEQITQDPTSGRFAATLNVMAEGMQPQRLRLSGRALLTQEVPVATRRLQVGAIVSQNDVRLARVPVARLQGDVVTEAPVGMVVRRAVASGQPFTTTSTTRPATIEKGMPVTVSFQNGGLTLELRGRALTSAVRGEAIQIENISSRDVIEAVVTGPGRARMNSMPSVQENP